MDKCRYCHIPVSPEAPDCTIVEGYPFCENCFNDPSPEERKEMIAAAKREGDPIR